MKIVAIEGVNGAGKSAAAAFVQRMLQASGQPCLVADPAGFGLVGQLLRRHVVHSSFEHNPDLDAVLFAAMRTEGARQILRTVEAAPSTVVILERWSLALAAYGAADGARRQLIGELRTVLQSAFAVDVTVLLDINGYLANTRLANDSERNRFELRGSVYLDDVARLYRHFAGHEARTEVIDASGDQARTGERLFAIISQASCVT